MLIIIIIIINSYENIKDVLAKLFNSYLKLKFYYVLDHIWVLNTYYILYKIKNIKYYDI